MRLSWLMKAMIVGPQQSSLDVYPLVEHCKISRDQPIRASNLLVRLTFADVCS